MPSISPIEEENRQYAYAAEIEGMAHPSSSDNHVLAMALAAYVRSAYPPYTPTLSPEDLWLWTLEHGGLASMSSFSRLVGSVLDTEGDPDGPMEPEEAGGEGQDAAAADDRTVISAFRGELRANVNSVEPLFVSAHEPGDIPF